MDVTKIWNNQKRELHITAKDLHESDDPLDNILLDVMFDEFYKRIKKQKSSKQNE